MSGVLPNRFLFRYSFPVRYSKTASPLKNASRNSPRTPWPFGLKDDFDLPTVDALDDGVPFGRLSLVWNQRGLGVAVKVRGRPVAFVERSALMPTPGCVAALIHL